MSRPREVDGDFIVDLEQSKAIIRANRAVRTAQEQAERRWEWVQRSAGYERQKQERERFEAWHAAERKWQKEQERIARDRDRRRDARQARRDWRKRQYGDLVQVRDWLIVGSIAPPRLAFDQIEAIVASRHKISRRAIRGQGRSDHIVAARHELMYFARAITGHSYPLIGRLLKRDHTTILHGARTHAERHGLPPVDTIEAIAATELLMRDRP